MERRNRKQDASDYEDEWHPASPFDLQRYAHGVEADDAVVLTVVPDEQQAEIVCGLLRSAGLECGYRDTEALDSALEEFAASGPREILVHAPDLETARGLLPDSG
jgi:hypothetical protein